jgi:competence protein ComEC
METKTLRIFKIILMPLFVATALVVYFDLQTQPDWRMQIDFFDVGQGDAILVTTYQGNQVLIDGGPGNSVLTELGKEMPLLDRQIEMVILTHPHLDHMEGLIQVLRRYNVQKIVLPNVAPGSDTHEEFLAEVVQETAQVIYAQQGQRIWLDNATVFDILHPRSASEWRPGTKDDLNDASVVGRLIFGQTSLMLTGDAGKNIESELVGQFNLDSDLLKVGHHGSKYSTSQEFLHAVSPYYAVVQVGEDNRYGHPAQETLDILKSNNIPVLRNDLHGTISFWSDGVQLVQQ